jgi:hypothetical protein
VFGFTVVSAGVLETIANPAARIAISAPVFTLTSRLPAAATGSITNWAVTAVVLVTVRGPYPPAGAPPTEIPGPKFACVAPWKKLLNVPVIATTRFCPGAPLTGFNEIVAGGLMVNVEGAELANNTLPVVAPDKDTR